MRSRTRRRRIEGFERGPVAVPPPPVRPAVEPIEPEHVANAALDRIEDDIRIVVEHGGEAALRLRLARLLAQNTSEGEA